MVERFHQSLKYEEAQSDECEDPVEVQTRFASYRQHYHPRRHRQALDYRAPAHTSNEQVSGEVQKPEQRSALVPGTISLW